MGYVSYSDVQQTGAEALSNAYTEISNCISKVEQSVDILLGIDGSTPPTNAQHDAFQFISDFSNNVGQYANVVGDKIADLRKSVMATILKKLTGILATISTDTHGDTTPVYFRTDNQVKSNELNTDNMHQANYAEILAHWNDGASNFVFAFQNPCPFGDLSFLQVPWYSGSLADDGAHQITTDKDGNTIPGSGITTDVEHVKGCNEHYDTTGWASAQSISNYVKPQIDPNSANFNYKAEINQEMIDAGLVPLPA